MPIALLGDNAAIAESLLKHSINTITVPNAPGFCSSIKDHADIQLCQIENHCFIHPLFDSITADEISNYSKIVKCTRPISEIYPYDAYAYPFTVCVISVIRRVFVIDGFK